MKVDARLKISVSVPVESEEAVADLLEDVLCRPVALVTNGETLWTEVSVLCAGAGAWTDARRRSIEKGLTSIRATGSPLGRARLRVERLPVRVQAGLLKRPFRALEIGRMLLVRSETSRRRSKPGQVEVVLDPEFSFGTGEHPTTGFCLAQVVAGRPRSHRPASFLDIGCGSGILAIAAAKLGYRPVAGFDYDPEAVRVAKRNATLNGVGGRVKFTRQDLRRLPVAAPRRYDVVCANLLASLLIPEFARIGARVRPGGRLVLAGIPSGEFPAVKALCEAHGFRLLAQQTVKGWKSGAFVAPRRPGPGAARLRQPEARTPRSGRNRERQRAP